MKALATWNRPAVWILVAVLAVAGVLASRGVGRREKATAAVPVQAVERRDIAVTIEATGTVEPIDLVEVKSKASGQIVKMPVEVGSQVARGALLAQIDTRDVRNAYDQTLAAMRAAQSRANVSAAQRKRSNELYEQQVITAPEHESATLEYANAQAQLVKARTDLDLARQRLEDATVRAPIAGTVLSQTVNSGQVITSATSSASGGTTLLTMADLARIRVRALVAESDVGNVRAGQEATVTVDAFPQRTFQGVVEKIEPQAVLQQSVTMFPVLIAIDNPGGTLLPGMNGEVTMLVNRVDDVLAVPVDAVRTAREAAAVATTLGLNADSVQAQVQRQVQARMAARGAGGDSLRAGGRRGGMRDSLAAGGGAARDSARRARWTARGGGGGRGGTGRSGAASGATAGGTGNGGGGFAGAGGGAGGFGAGGARGSRASVVFVKTERGLVPRVVRLGLSDFDYAQVLDGLEEGEQVAMLGVAEALSSRAQQQEQIRRRVGTGVPGTGTAGGGGGRGAGGGGGGGGR